VVGAWDTDADAARRVGELRHVRFSFVAGPPSRYVKARCGWVLAVAANYDSGFAGMPTLTDLVEAIRPIEESYASS
jgi:hypothetical protein